MSCFAERNDLGEPLLYSTKPAAFGIIDAALDHGGLPPTVLSHIFGHHVVAFCDGLSVTLCQFHFCRPFTSMVILGW